MSITLRTIGLIVGWLALFSNLYAANTPNLKITKTDILNVYRDKMGRIDNLSLSFDMGKRIKDKNTLQIIQENHLKISLVTKGDLFRTRKQDFGDRSEEEGPVWDHEWSADGKTVYHLDVPSLFGTVEKKLPGEAAIKQSWGLSYITANWMAPREQGNRGFEANLIGVLEEIPDRIKLYDKTELFEGRETVVLEIPKFCRLYLDPQIGFAVVGFESEMFGGRVVNSNFKKVAEGLWLPMHSESVYTNESNNIVEKKIDVTDLKVNQGLTTEDFKIEFPMGVRIYDRNLKLFLPPTQYGISGEYLDEVLNIALDRDMVDVYHVSEKTSRQTKNSGTDNAINSKKGEKLIVMHPTLLKNNVAENTVDKELDITTGSNISWRWQKVVIVCVFALTILVLLHQWCRYKSYGRNKPQQ